MPAKEPAGVSAPRLLPMLMIISAVLSLTGQHHLYSALHSLQVAAPLHILSPQDLAKVLQALATASLQLTFGSRGATQTHIPDEALCSGRPQARLAASVAPVPACGLAVATFISFYQKRSPNELPDSCCSSTWLAFPGAGPPVKAVTYLVGQLLHLLCASSVNCRSIWMPEG